MPALISPSSRAASMTPQPSKHFSMIICASPTLKSCLSWTKMRHARRSLQHSAHTSPQTTTSMKGMQLYFTTRGMGAAWPHPLVGPRPTGESRRYAHMITGWSMRTERRYTGFPIGLLIRCYASLQLSKGIILFVLWYSIFLVQLTYTVLFFPDRHYWLLPCRRDHARNIQQNSSHGTLRRNTTPNHNLAFPG